MAKTAGIVIIGDEILSGKFADENAELLISELRSLGVDLRRIAIIPDEVDDIATTVRSFSERFDYVFTSGGVGVTHDDMTIAAIAQGFSAAVVRHPRLEQIVRDHWGENLAEANLRLAEIPAGAELVGDDDRWPALRFANVYILPGVPALFKHKFLSIRELFRTTPVVERRLYCSAEEGELAAKLSAVASAFPKVRIGSYPRFGEKRYRVIVTVEGADGAVVDGAISALRERLGDCARDGEDVE